MSTRPLNMMMLSMSLLLAPLAPAKALRDPTRQPVVRHHAARAVEPLPVLSAVMSSGRNRVAIFNGQLVHSGESVGTYRIQAVFEDGLRYRHAGASHDLYITRNVSFKKLTMAAARPTAGEP